MQLAHLSAKGYTEINRELSYRVIQSIMFLNVDAYTHHKTLSRPLSLSLAHSPAIYLYL